MSELQPLLRTSNSKGGLKTLPFIIVNEAFEKLASYGLTPNMIVYLMGRYGMKLTTGSNYIYFWTAAQNFAPVIGAFLADSFVGRYHMVGFGSMIALLGMIFLWFTAIIPGAAPCDESNSDCGSANVLQLALLISSYVFMSIGGGGVRSSSFSFVADQLVNGDNVGCSNILERLLNWYQFASGVGTVLAFTVLVYIQENYGWKVGYGVPATFMMLSALSFYMASPIYVKLKPKGGSPVSYVRVLVASWKKRHLTLLETTDLPYYLKEGSRLKIPTDRLRFLDKACIVVDAKEEVAPDGSVLDPWKLCDIDQVEELKAIVKVIPIWSAAILVNVNGNQAGVLQARSMDRHVTSNFEIPAGSFGSFTIVSIVLWLVIYDRLIIPLAMIIMAIIEGVRREKAIQEGFADNPNGVIHMSALWLLLHGFIFGVAEAFLVIAQTEFFYTEFPKSMSSIATNIGSLSRSVASLLSSLLMNTVDSITSKAGKESWVSSNINKGHIDYYNWLLAGLYLLNFFYYLLCSRAYGASDAQDMVLTDEDETTCQ